MWPIKEMMKQMLEAAEMDFWRRTTGRSRLETVTNERTGEIMQVTHESG